MRAGYYREEGEFMTKGADTQRVNPKVAAAEIGCSVPYMYQQMRRGNWDLGNVVKPGRSSRKHQYFIFRAKLDEHLGICRQDVVDFYAERE